MSDNDIILLSSDDSNPPVDKQSNDDVEILTPFVKQEISDTKLELKPDRAQLEAFLKDLSELPGSNEVSDSDDNATKTNNLNKIKTEPSKSENIPLPENQFNAILNEISQRNSQDKSAISSTCTSKTLEEGTSPVKIEKHLNESQEIDDFEHVVIKSEFLDDDPLCRAPEKSERERASTPDNTSISRTNKTMASPRIYNFERKSQKRVYPMSPIASHSMSPKKGAYPMSPISSEKRAYPMSPISSDKRAYPMSPIASHSMSPKKGAYPMSPIAPIVSKKGAYAMSPIASEKGSHPNPSIESPKKTMGKSCSQILMEKAEKEKCVAVYSAKSGQSPAQPCDYEVEKILDQKELGPERFLYKVKWVGFDETECTWEPLEHLTDCLQLVHEFKMKHVKIPTNPVERRFQQLRKYMMQHTDAQLVLFTQRFRSDKGELSIPKIDLNEINGFIRNFARHPHLIENNKAELNYLREQLLTSIIYEKRLVQMENLKRYEMEINVTTGNAVAPIYVINNVDLEVVPANFTHTNHNIPTEGVVVPEEPIIWCECKDNCKDSSFCCGELNDSVVAYDKYKRLKIGQGTPIYECNKNCKCNNSCPNRVIQLGTQVKLAIYKTYNGCGWGVQTLEPIPKGTYVTEYVGEILTYQAASRRTNQTYLFDLDFNGSTAYVIDACTYGNISHFINHSCDPNLAVYPAYIQCLDPYLHRLPLFAIRDIEKGEQLSFSYYKSVTRQSGRSTSESGIQCKCEAKNCRGWLNIEG